jgi:hypothetical protein
MRVSGILFGSATILLLCFAGAATAEPEATPIVAWHPDRAIFGGSGCNAAMTVDGKPSVEMIAFDQDLSMVFNTLKLRMDRGSNTDSVLSQCNVRLPVEIVRGFYIGRLTQVLTFGVVKTQGLTVTGSAQSTFFNVPVSTVTVGAGEDEEFTRDNPALLTGEEVDFIGVAAFCRGGGRGNTLKGVYRTGIGIGARRSDRTATLDAEVSALDARWDVEADWFLCP